MKKYGLIHTVSRNGKDSSWWIRSIEAINLCEINTAVQFMYDSLHASYQFLSNLWRLTTKQKVTSASQQSTPVVNTAADYKNWETKLHFSPFLVAIIRITSKNRQWIYRYKKYSIYNYSFINYNIKYYIIKYKTY